LLTDEVDTTALAAPPSAAAAWDALSGDDGGDKCVSLCPLEPSSDRDLPAWVVAASLL